MKMDRKFWFCAMILIFLGKMICYRSTQLCENVRSMAVGVETSVEHTECLGRMQDITVT